jgi:hypothetical protein
MSRCGHVTLLFATSPTSRSSTTRKRRFIFIAILDKPPAQSPAAVSASLRPSSRPSTPILSLCSRLRPSPALGFHPSLRFCIKHRFIFSAAPCRPPPAGSTRMSPCNLDSRPSRHPRSRPRASPPRTTPLPPSRPRTTRSRLPQPSCPPAPE